MDLRSDMAGSGIAVAQRIVPGYVLLMAIGIVKMSKALDVIAHPKKWCRQIVNN
jgi:hypothetical protein